MKTNDGLSKNSPIHYQTTSPSYESVVEKQVI